MNRKKAIARLAGLIAQIKLEHPARIGIDGVAVSGKSTLADELACLLQNMGREVITLSGDGFHNPSNIRHRQGPLSPQGYYEDSFNHDLIISAILKPLGKNGNLNYRDVAFDLHTDLEINRPLKKASQNAILLFEGIFLHRPELRGHWDFSIFIHTDFDITIKRAQKRDLQKFKSAENVQERFEKRFIPGAQKYLDAEIPSKTANVFWENSDIENPSLIVNDTFS